MRVSEPSIRKPITPPSAKSASDTARAKKAGSRQGHGPGERSARVDKRNGEDQRRRGDAELQKPERLALMVGEGRENRVERRRGDRDQRDETDGGKEDAVIDRLFAQAHAREDRPVRHHERGVDELQHVTAAPEQFLARRQLAGMREQRRGDGKTDQRENVDEAAKRHRDRKRRRGSEPSRQIDEKTNDRRKHAQSQRQSPRS